MHHIQNQIWVVKVRTTTTAATSIINERIAAPSAEQAAERILKRYAERQAAQLRAGRPEHTVDILNIEKIQQAAYDRSFAVREAAPEPEQNIIDIDRPAAQDADNLEHARTFRARLEAERRRRAGIND
jgi:hypothetical protein